MIYQYMWENEESNRSVEVEIEFEVTQFVPASLYGPAEKCYPAEGGQPINFSFAVHSITYMDENRIVLNVLSEEDGTLTDEIKKGLEKEFAQYFRKNKSDFVEKMIEIWSY